jgi:mRNA-degrading endonuclease toxin of MazEF toxin-antitoxin module
VYDRGTVVIAADPFKAGGRRPFVLISNRTHPFQGTEYIAATMTTTERDDAISISDDDWEVGSSPRDSYVSPWAVMTLKDAEIDRRVGRLRASVLRQIAEELYGYVVADE